LVTANSFEEKDEYIPYAELSDNDDYAKELQCYRRHCAPGDSYVKRM
jgi:hypothetical protein